MQLVPDDLKCESARTLHNAKLANINILLFGIFGNGKSSFINTALSGFSPTVVKKAIAKPQDTHVTLNLRKYNLISNINLWDTWGLSNENYVKGEFQLIMKGYLKNGHDKDEEVEFGAQPNSNNIMHGIIFIISKRELETFNNPLKRLQLFHSEAEKIGINGVIVVTHSDLFTGENEKTEAEQKIRKFFPNAKIFFVENYLHNENNKNIKKEAKVLDVVTESISTYLIKVEEIIENEDLFDINEIFNLEKSIQTVSYCDD